MCSLNSIRLGKIVSTTWAMLLVCLAKPVAAAWEEHLGPLAASVDTISAAPWAVAETGGWFMLENAADPAAIRYYWSSSELEMHSKYDVSVNLAVRSATRETAFAGLLFGFKSPQSYFAVTIGSDKTAVLFIRNEDGLQQYQAEGILARNDGSDILAARVSGNDGQFLLNGATLFSFDSPDGFTPQHGIIAIGAGQFGFTGYRIDTDGRPLVPEQPQSPEPQSTPAQAETPIPAGNESLAKAYLGTTLGIFYHELGHALINETDLPAPGPEEDVADSFSAYILASSTVETDVNEGKQDLAEIAEYGALTWYHLSRRARALEKEHDWQDEHSPDIKRFRNMFCIIYGADPDTFDPLATRVGFEPRTRQRCLQEYQPKYDAWEQLLTLKARNLADDLPGVHPANTPGGSISLNFQPSKFDYGTNIAALLQVDNFLQQITALFEQYIVWPRDLDITFRDCRSINAWYDPSDASVTMCYSLIEWITSIVAKAENIPKPE